MIKRRHSRLAFTLVEMLLAVSMTVLVVVMLGNMFCSLTSTSLKANQRIDAFRDARSALSMIKRDMANLVRAVPTAYFALADQYSDPNTATTKNRQIYGLTAIKSGVGDLCAVGYYCYWDSATHAYSLHRYFRTSTDTFGLLQSNGAGIYAPVTKLYTPGITDETVTAYAWNLQITAYNTDGSVNSTYPLIIDPSNPAVSAPAVLEISFDAISPQAAQAMLSVSSAPNDWMDSTTTNYKQLLAPHMYGFRTRVNLQ